jgi:ribosomal protein S27AE
MSVLCGGKENVFKDTYWLIRHLLKKNRDSCPRCGYSAFRHGFPPHDDTYCTKCHLWEPDWEEYRKWTKEIQNA